MKTAKTLWAISALVSLALFLPQHAAAADAYDACKTMMAKLAVQYTVETYGSTDKAFADPLGRAESMVRVAFDIEKAELDKKWPGLWQFSTLAVIDGMRKRTKADEFRVNAFVSCVRTFG